MTFEEFKQYLEENKSNDEVKTLLNSEVLTTDNVTTYLDTEDGKRLLQPRLDRYHSKSLESWKENNLQSLIDDAVSKLNPQETEEQKRIRELEENLKRMEAEKLRSERLNKTMEQLTKDGLPTTLAHLLISDDEEKATENIEAYKQTIESIKEEAKKTLLQENGRPNVLGGKTPDTSEDELKSFAKSIFGSADDQPTESNYFKE